MTKKKAQHGDALNMGNMEGEKRCGAEENVNEIRAAQGLSLTELEKKEQEKYEVASALNET